MADSIYHAVGLTAARWPGKTAVVDDKGQALTYGRLLDMTDRMAASLKKKTGIQKGERIGILLYNGPEFCVSYLAANKIWAGWRFLSRESFRGRKSCLC